MIDNVHLEIKLGYYSYGFGVIKRYDEGHVIYRQYYPIKIEKMREMIKEAQNIKIHEVNEDTIK